MRKQTNFGLRDIVAFTALVGMLAGLFLNYRYLAIAICVTALPTYFTLRIVRFFRPAPAKKPSVIRRVAVVIGLSLVFFLLYAFSIGPVAFMIVEPSPILNEFYTPASRLFESQGLEMWYEEYIEWWLPEER